MCPHFSSSFEWFPVTNLTHLHTLHVPNNFFDYPVVNGLVTHLQASAVTSLDLGQHRMLAPETLAIVEALTAPTGAAQLVTLRLDVSKYSDVEHPHVDWQQISENASHLVTNVRHAPIIGCLNPCRPTASILCVDHAPRAGRRVLWSGARGREIPAASAATECACLAVPLRVRWYSLTRVSVRVCEQTTLKEIRCLCNRFPSTTCTRLLKAFEDNLCVKTLCEPREYALRIDDEDRTAYTLEDVRIVLVSSNFDLADWHPLFTNYTHRERGVSFICTRLKGGLHPPVLNISNTGWSVTDIAQCVEMVGKSGKRPCVPAVTLLPVGWSKVGVCFRRPDGEFVRRSPDEMETGFYRPQPPFRRTLVPRCLICTKELSAHAPPRGVLHKLDLSHNLSLGHTVPPPGWVRGEQLTKVTRGKPVGYKWTHPPSDGRYFGESPPGSTLLAAEALGDALLYHQTLTELDVSFTSLRDRGCAHLVRGLKGNVSALPCKCQRHERGD